MRRIWLSLVMVLCLLIPGPLSAFAEGDVQTPVLEEEEFELEAEEFTVIPPMEKDMTPPGESSQDGDDIIQLDDEEGEAVPPMEQDMTPPDEPSQDGDDIIQLDDEEGEAVPPMEQDMTPPVASEENPDEFELDTEEGTITFPTLGEEVAPAKEETEEAQEEATMPTVLLISEFYEDGEFVGESMQEVPLSEMESAQEVEIVLHNARADRLQWYGDQLHEAEKKAYQALVATDDLTVAKQLNDKGNEIGIEVNLAGYFSMEELPRELFTNGTYKTTDSYKQMHAEVTEAITRTMAAFEYDFPEEFWFGGSSFSVVYGIVATKETKEVDGVTQSVETGLWHINSVNVRIKLKDNYEGVRNEIADVNAAVDTAYAAIAAETEDAGREAIVKAVYNYIVDLATEPTENAGYAPYHSLPGVLLDKYGHTGTSEAYAKLAKVLLDRFDIPNVLVAGYYYGTSQDKLNALWNLVQMEDGSWLLLDCSLDDQKNDRAYRLAYGEYYGYFDDVTVAEDHIPSGSMLGYQESFVHPELAMQHAHEHSWKLFAERTASCSEEGYRIFKCEVCRKALKEKIDKTPHELGDWTVVKEATDHKDGLKARICIHCDETIETEVIPATGHVWSDDYSVIKPSTATEKGVKARRCNVCDATTDEREIPCNPFTDVAGDDWFYANVMDVLEMGLMTGMNNTYFGATETLSRAHLVAILYRRAGYPISEYRAVFPDVKDGEWYTQCVLWAWANEVMYGYKNGTFGPADYLTREQLCTILFRYAKEVDGIDTSARAELDKYTDAANISSFALDAMQWCEAAGLISGTADGRIGAWDFATRADCATMISRYMNLVRKSKAVD